MSFSTLLDTPFYTGHGGLSDQVPYPWPIAIDGRPFAIDLAHYAWDVPDMMRSSFDSSDRPGEGTYETHGVWRRIYQDWSLGAGQIYADAPDKTSARQFTTSLGVDPWTPRQISLLPDTELLQAGSTPELLLALGPYLYTVSGGQVARTTNPEAITPTFAVVVANLQGIYDWTTDGNSVYIASVSGIWIHDSSAIALSINQMPGVAGQYAATVVEFANGWLIAAKNAELVTFDSLGAKTVINTRPITGWQWTAIVGAPNAIYAGGQSADRACIYSIGVDGNTGGLGPAIYAGELPRGETLTSLNYYGTLLAIGTSKGLHLAEIGSNGQLAIGPLIPTGAPVDATAADANFVWFGWSDYDATHTGVGRANLAEFSSTLLPAYATDLMAATQGAVTSIARFDGRTYFAVDGVGLYRQTVDGSVVTTAQVRLGRLEWGTAAAKTFLGVEIVTEPLDGTFSVTLEDETLEQTPIGGRIAQESTGRGTMLGSGLGTNSNFYDLIIDFTRSTDNTDLGPVLRTVTARALPLPTSSRTWQLPILAESFVHPEEDSEVPQDVWDIWEFFIALRVEGRPVIYQEGSKGHHLVVVRSVGLPEGQAHEWTADRSAIQGTLLVTLASADD